MGSPATVSGRLPYLQQWELVRLLGSGSWCQAYQARPRGGAPGGPADYVVKLIPDDSPQWGLAVSTLQREVEVAREVEHRHLVSVLKVHLREMPCYTVMPYLPGKTLHHWLARRTLPLAAALWVTRQIAQALAALHAAGWIHADVKPRNILVSPQGHATLIDLGLARRLGSSECATTAPRVGTVGYMPPEMREGSEPITPAVDIHSLGVTLGEMLTGVAARGPDRLPAVLTVGRLGGLLESMLAPIAAERPSAETLVRQLSSLEIEHFRNRAA